MAETPLAGQVTEAVTSVFQAAGGETFRPPLWALVVAILRILIGLLAIIMNGMLATLISIRRLYFKDNRFIFILALCVMDLLTGMGLVVRTAGSMVGGVHAYLCLASILFLHSAGLLAAWGVFILSLDQFLHIQLPLVYVQWMTPDRVHLLMGSPLLLSLCNIALLFMLWHDRSSCDYFREIPFWYHILSTAFYLAILAGASVLQTACLWVARQHLRHIQAANEAASAQGSSTSTNPVSQMKTVKTLAAILGIFMLCWMPISIANLSVSFNTQALWSNPMALYAFNACLLLFYLNIILNPVVYALRLSELRMELMKCFKCYRPTANGIGQNS